MISRTPAAKPRNPRMRENTGSVPNRLSIKYPSPPAITTAATGMNGSSIAKAGSRAKPSDFRGGWGGSLSPGLSGEPKGVARELREGFRIQPRSEGHKYGRRERHGLPRADHRTRRFTWLLHPGVHHDAEIIVERRHDIQSAENGQDRMLCFDQRQEDEIFPHEARRRWNPRQGEHENQQEERRSRTALVEPIEVFQFVADQTLAPEQDDHGKRSRGHERVDKQIVRNSLIARIICGHQSEKDIADVGDGRVSEQALHVRLRDRGKVSPRQRSRSEEHTSELQSRENLVCRL